MIWTTNVSLWNSVFTLGLLIHPTTISTSDKAGRSEYGETNWINFGDYSYGVAESSGNYLTAMLLCRNYGAHVVSIQSEAENTFVLSLTNWFDLYYIGAMSKPWQYLSEYWTDGSELTYSNWSPISEKTGCSVISSITSKWYKIHGDDRIYNAICKRPLKPTVRNSDYAGVVFLRRYLESTNLKVVENPKCRVFQCLRECMNEFACIGFNFVRYESTCLCQLKGAEVWLIQKIVPSANSSYWERISM